VRLRAVPAPETQELPYKPEARHTRLVTSYSSLFASQLLPRRGEDCAGSPCVTASSGRGQRVKSLCSWDQEVWYWLLSKKYAL